MSVKQMYTLCEHEVDTNTIKTALLSKPNPQISGSIRGKMGFNQLDKNIPAGTPSMPDVTVTTPNTSEILDFKKKEKKNRRKRNAPSAHIIGRFREKKKS